jgi:poly(A) polymerase
MPRRLIEFIGRAWRPSAPQARLRVIPRAEHSISRRDISGPALKVLYRLKDAGYEGYLVGGGVRDLLLGGHPKDFDVATNATPEQVRKVFGNCRIVGRRFRLAHVLFGRDVVEVATFRAGHEAGEPGDEDHVDDDASEVHEHTGMILRDNVWGNVEQDALRRDFTVNALYYNIADFSVHDYVDGLKDLEKRRLRLIGDPETRYREDPVRMLRAARFAAKLGFTIEDRTRKPIATLRPLLNNIPPARLFDETLKLLLAGYGQASWQQLEALGLAEALFPETIHETSRDPAARTFVLAALANSDARLAEGKSVTPAFLFAALLWPVVATRYRQLLAEGVPEVPAIGQAAQQVLDEQCRRVAIPRRFSVPAREIWELQLRLEKRQGRRAAALLTHPRFRAAWDFLVLREQAGALRREPADLFAGKPGDWWADFQSADPDARGHMVRSLDAQGPGSAGDGKRRRRRGGRNRRRTPGESA